MNIRHACEKTLHNLLTTTTFAILFFASCAQTIDRALVSNQSTLAHRLLSIERHLTQDCAGNDGAAWYEGKSTQLDSLLRVISSRISQFNRTDWRAATPEQATKLMVEVDKAIHDAGYVVCIKTEYLSQSFDEAPRAVNPARPRQLDVDGQACYIWGNQAYRQSAREKWKPNGWRPLDCDLGSVVIMSLTENVQLPLAFVAIPRHNFVRWHFPESSLNWDFNNAAWYTDDDYRFGRVPTSSGFSKDTERENGYLRDMSQKEIEDYYTSIRFNDVKSSVCVSDYFDALPPGGSDSPHINNALAWAFVTRPEFRASRYVAESLKLAQHATEEKPICNHWDTLSCAYAAVGKFEEAIRIEQERISPSSLRIPAFRKRKDCYTAEVASSGACPQQ